MTRPLERKRALVTREVAALVAHLAGPGAGFVTKASLTIDRGFTA